PAGPGRPPRQAPVPDGCGAPGSGAARTAGLGPDGRCARRHRQGEGRTHARATGTHENESSRGNKYHYDVHNQRGGGRVRGASVLMAEPALKLAPKPAEAPAADAPAPRAARQRRPLRFILLIVIPLIAAVGGIT